MFLFDLRENWDSARYVKFLEYLVSLQDMEYKEFQGRLVPNSRYEIIGIRTPIMKSIAKEISRGDVAGFLECAQNNYYEEVMIKGFVISHIRDEDAFYLYFKSYINLIDNWALCDSFCSSVKIVKKFEAKYFEKCLQLCLDKSEFVARIGLVMILNHFISRKNLLQIFQTLNRIEIQEFYVNMAMAWLVSELYIKFPGDTEVFLKDNNMNRFTQNKAICKIGDSHRVDAEDKFKLRKYKK